MAKTILTQGTEIFCLAPTAVGLSTKAIFKINGASEFNPGDETSDEIPTTELAENKAHTFAVGLTDPGEASITLQVNPADPKHKLLYDLRGEPLEFFVGWADGKAEPALATAGGVQSIAITNGGSDYASAPTVSFSGGGGTGAAATAVVEDGEVVAINITNPGSGYTSNPTVSFSGGSGTGAAATATISSEATATLPVGRTWFKFSGAIKSFPFDFTSNSVVKATMTIRRSGSGVWTPKSSGG